jgi:formyltetrahydrofolate-dependent phosphoribosylglycinamide formyltransferase
MNNKPTIIVLISGSGTNLQAIIDAIEENVLQAEISLVLSNRKAAYGLVRAAQHGIPTLYHPLKPYRDAGKTREEYEADLAAKLRPLRPDLIVLAGWMHVLGAGFLDQFPQKVINLHPALPGQFAGTNAIQRAYDAYQRGDITYSGCMIHYVVPEVDAGPVIKQAIVPIEPDDSVNDFEARMHTTEHHLIVEAIHKVLSGRDLYHTRKFV